MELPNDIWEEIIKQSKKTNDEIVADMNLKQLFWLEHTIREKKMERCNDIKSKLDKYDVVEINTQDGLGYEYIIADDCRNEHRYIKCFKLVAGITKSIFGNYQYGCKKIEKIDLYDYELYDINIKIKSKCVDRYNANINIANKLKVGDVFCYSLYTSAEWCKCSNHYEATPYDMELFDLNIRYDMVRDITSHKLIIINYNKSFNTEHQRFVSYINKYMILNKVEYADNAGEFIKCKKKLLLDSILEIDKINNNKFYFDNVNKKQLIKIQERLKLRR